MSLVFAVLSLLVVAEASSSDNFLKIKCHRRTLFEKSPACLAYLRSLSLSNSTLPLSNSTLSLSNSTLSPFNSTSLTSTSSFPSSLSPLFSFQISPVLLCLLLLSLLHFLPLLLILHSHLGQKPSFQPLLLSLLFT